MHEHDVGVAAAADVERLARCRPRDHAHVDAGRLLEQPAAGGANRPDCSVDVVDAMTMNLSCAHAGARQHTQTTAGQRPYARLIISHGNSPFKKQRRLARQHIVEEAIDRQVDHQASQPRGTPRASPGALGLTEVVRAHHHRHAVVGELIDQTLDLALGAGVQVRRCGSSSSRMSGSSAQARASARRCCWPPDSARARAGRQPRSSPTRCSARAHSASARCGARHAVQPQTQQHVAAHRQAERGTDAGTASPSPAAGPAARRPRGAPRTAPGRATSAAAWSCPSRWRPPAPGGSPRCSVRLMSCSACTSPKAHAGCAPAAAAASRGHRPGCTASATVRATRSCTAALRHTALRARPTCAACIAPISRLTSPTTPSSTTPSAERQRQVALAGLQRDRGGHHARDAVDVAADDHHRADLGHGAAERRSSTHRQRRAKRSCTSISSALWSGPAPSERSWSPPSRSHRAPAGATARRSVGTTRIALRDHHRGRREQDAQSPSGPERDSSR